MPSAYRKIREIERILQEHMDLFGYNLIDMPIIEKAEIFLTRAGHNIIERLFTFDRGGHLLALRPEFTAAAAHRYAQEDYQEPVRWQVSGAIFEDEPSDYSLQYQKHTIGAELIGQNGAAADAEMIGMAVQGIQKLGIEDFTLIIGHVGLQLHLLAQFRLDSRTSHLLLSQRERLKTEGKQATLDYIHDALTLDDTTKLEEMNLGQSEQTQYMLDVLLDSTRYGTTMGGRSRHDIAQRLLQKRERTLEQSQIVSALDFLAEWGQIRSSVEEVLVEVKRFIADDDKVGQALLEKWQQSLELLSAYDIPQATIILQPDLTKNWDYYTGMVFGIRANHSYIASGGRYDGLTKLLGSDENAPAVGFAYYTEPLLAALSEIVDTAKILTLSKTTMTDLQALQWANALRSAGIAILIVESTETDIHSDGETLIFCNQRYSRDTLETLIQDIKANQQ
jgi:histidyl-tRNA synthetase